MNVTKTRKSFFGLKYSDPQRTPIWWDELGGQFETSGLLLQGKNNQQIVILLPNAATQNTYPLFVSPSQDEWKGILQQLDNPDIFIRDATGLVKAIVKKNERQIGIGIQWKIFGRDNFICQYCGADGRKGIPMSIDHKIPVERGGTDDEDNLTTACRKCNKMKGDKLISEMGGQKR